MTDELLKLSEETKRQMALCYKNQKADSDDGVSFFQIVKILLFLVNIVGEVSLSSDF